MRLPFDLSIVVLTILAVAMAIVAFVKDPSLPMIGARIVSWEAPLMGWPFVGVRVLSSFAFPVLAGWLISVFHHD